MLLLPLHNICPQAAKTILNNSHKIYEPHMHTARTRTRKKESKFKQYGFADLNTLNNIILWTNKINEGLPEFYCNQLCTRRIYKILCFVR